MDTEMMEMFQLILEKIDNQDKRFDALDKKIDTEIDSVKTMMNDEIRSVKIMIENDVTKRLDSLFDGYQSVHEKQFELEQRVKRLEIKVG